MATEEGIVLRTSGTEAVVKTVKSGVCKGCTARGSCHSMGENDEMEVDVINAAGAKVGDRIVLNLETGPLLKVTFLLYVFPIIVLIIGAALGQRIATMLGLDSSGLSVLVGFFFLFAAVLFIKKKANKLAKRNKYRPTIVKILK